MARENAYGTSVPAGALRGLARALRCPPGKAQPNETLVRFEPAVRRAIPAMIGLFLAVLAAVAGMQLQEARRHALDRAVADMEMVGAAAAEDVESQAAGRERSNDKSNRFAIPARVLSHGRQVLVTDGHGDIIARFPPNIEARGLLADHLGNAQALSIFAEKAGVMRIALGNGEDAIAHVRTLASPLGQIAFIHPIRAVMGEWEAQALRTGIAFSATAIVIIMLTSAFLWQAKRASTAETGCDRVRDRIDTALSRGHCGLWDWDIARGRIYWSSSMYEVLGMEESGEYLSFGEVNGLMHPDDGDLTDMAEMLASSQSNAIDHAFRLRNAKGEWIWLRARAEMVQSTPSEGAHLVGIAVDITEQKRQAERNITADMRLRDALETVSEALVLWDGDNRLVMCNSKFQLLHRLSPEAIRPGTSYRHVMEHSTPLDVQSQAGLAGRPLNGAQTYEVRLSDGRWLQINERRTKDGGYVSVGTDISQIKTHEVQLMDSERRLTATVADLRRSRQALELQAQQLAQMAEKYFEQKAVAESASLAKSRFLANMSHELRTPLNAIIGFAEMMQQQVFGALGSAKYAEYCDHIHEGGRYLLGVITDVLDMSNLESGRVRLARQEFAVDTAVANVLAEISPLAAAKNIRLLAEEAAGARLAGHQGSVEKILMTLLRNAVKFTPEGGRVMLRTRQVGEAINIYIEDTGIGMSAGAVQRLGRPFEQPGPIFENGMKGSGLGLAIARSLIELHEGTLRIRSTEGAGTIVLVHLPAPGRAPERLPQSVAA